MLNKVESVSLFVYVLSSLLKLCATLYPREVGDRPQTLYFSKGCIPCWLNKLFCKGKFRSTEGNVVVLYKNSVLMAGKKLNAGFKVELLEHSSK